MSGDRKPDIDQSMLKAGWILADSRVPGFYVRTPQAIRSDQFNWRVEPAELLRFLEDAPSSSHKEETV